MKPAVVADSAHPSVHHDFLSEHKILETAEQDSIDWNVQIPSRPRVKYLHIMEKDQHCTCASESYVLVSVRTVLASGVCRRPLAARWAQGVTQEYCSRFCHCGITQSSHHRGPRCILCFFVCGSENPGNLGDYSMNFDTWLKRRKRRICSPSHF